MAGGNGEEAASMKGEGNVLSQAEHRRTVCVTGIGNLMLAVSSPKHTQSNSNTAHCHTHTHKSKACTCMWINIKALDAACLT